MSRILRRTPRRPIPVGPPRSKGCGMSEVKFGALCWNLYSDWPALLEAGIRADRLGSDTLRAWDHR